MVADSDVVGEGLRWRLEYWIDVRVSVEWCAYLGKDLRDAI